MNKKPAQSGSKSVSALPNVLLLPAPHHRRWGWLIWTVIIIGLLFLALWLLRGYKPTTSIAEAEDNRANYGKFDVIENGPQLLGAKSNTLVSAPYHATLSDGKILFVVNSSDLTVSNSTDAQSDTKPPAQKVFLFDPATNQFTDSPIVLDDPYSLDSYILTADNRLAVFDLDPNIVTDASGEKYSQGLGGHNPRIDFYDIATGTKQTVMPTGEDLSISNFAGKPYLFSIKDGILVGAVAYSDRTSTGAVKPSAITFTYNQTTQKLTKKVGSIGLPDGKATTSQPTVALSGDKTLIFDRINLYLFDHSSQKAVFKRRLTGYQADKILIAKPIPDTSLVYIIASDTDAIHSDSIVYIYNFQTNSLFSYRLGNKPLQQGKLTSDSTGGIPRETTDNDNSTATITENGANQYYLQPLSDGTILTTGSRYYDLPWSYGLSTLINNQWLARANSADPDSIDPKSNYADKIVATAESNQTASSCTIRDAFPLADGRILYAGCLWFVYTPDTAKTTMQLTNATTINSRFGEVGRWTDGGKLLLGEMEKRPINDPAYNLPDDAIAKFGTPYPLKDGRVFFFNPVFKASTYSGDKNPHTITSDVIGQLYNPKTNTSRWVKSSSVKGKNLFYNTIDAGYGTERYSSGIMDAKGNLHLIDFATRQELVYYPASGKTKLRILKNPTITKGTIDADFSSILSGMPVAVDDKILFFTGKSIGVLNIKTGQYYDLAKKREFDWYKQHSKSKATAEQSTKWQAGIPIFNTTGQQIAPPVFGVPSTTGNSATPLGVESALLLGNSRIMLTSGNQIKIYNYKTETTEDFGMFKNLTHATKLFRMSDGRSVAVGLATLSTEQASGSTVSNAQDTFGIEVINVTDKTVSDTVTNPYFPVGKTNDVNTLVWILPNDRLLFSSQLGTRMSLYDLQKSRWLAAPEALVNLGYGNENLIMQLPTDPTIIKIATKLGYTDYTKEIPVVSDVLQSNATVLDANAVELFIPETGPWGYYDAIVSHLNWWLWWLTIQLVQGLGGATVILTRIFRRKYIMPL